MDLKLPNYVRVIRNSSLKEDKPFAFLGLKGLWESKGLDCPMTAYVYAYCLNHKEHYDESLSILAEAAWNSGNFETVADYPVSGHVHVDQTQRRGARRRFTNTRNGWQERDH